MLGSEAFARKLRQQIRGNASEQPAFRRLACRATWEQIVAALEEAKGESWAKFSQLHGDWGRDAALWLGRRRGGYRLAELANWLGAWITRR